jgi:hypothetical protein
MPAETESEINFQQLKTAVIIAILVGLATSTFFLVVEKESYTSVYLIPDSIIYDLDNHTVYYVYGVSSSENQKTDYTLDTYIGDELIKTKQFSLNNGETREEGIKTGLPSEVQYPVKITLSLNGSKTESVHFWLNNETF